MNAPRAAYVRPLDIKRGHVDMSHGAGGKAASQLIEEVFLPALDNPFLRQGDDGAVLPWPGQDGGRLVMATDGHVVSPLFFPGGDLGALAVHGTVNDVAMMGAKPLYLSASFILEEGFALADLQRLAQSMGQAAREAGVPIVTGDTKVVERGKGDGVFISTTGVGLLPAGRDISGRRAQVGDHVLVSGTLGDHGVAVLSKRESLAFETEIVSDTAALHGLVDALLEALGPAIHVLRDPTRGGLGNTLNELAHQSGVGITIDEGHLPIQPQVAAACELLGLDPLYVANEGKLILICDPAASDTALAVLRSHPLGGNAARIGEVHADPHHFVQMRTQLGGRRVVGWLNGEQLPRIC